MFDIAPPLQQTQVYADAVRLLGARADRLDLPGGRALILRRQWPLLGEVAMISRGPVWTHDATPVTTCAGLRRRIGAHHLIIHADRMDQAAHLLAAGFRRLHQGPTVADLSLSGGPRDWAARMQGKWRNRLRHALSHPLRVQRATLPPDPRHWIFRADAAVARRRGYRPMPPAMIAALAAVRPGAVQILTAFDRDHPVAAMVFLRCGPIAVYQIGWSDTQGRAMSAGNLLMWQAMLALHQMGVDRIELGLADAATAPGLARFKTGTGAALRQTGGTWIDTALLPRRVRRGALGQEACGMVVA